MDIHVLDKLIIFWPKGSITRGNLEGNLILYPYFKIIVNKLKHKNIALAFYYEKGRESR